MGNPGRPKTKWGNREVRDSLIDSPPAWLESRLEVLDCGTQDLTIWGIEISFVFNFGTLVFGRLDKLKIGNSGVRIFEYFKDNAIPNFVHSMALMLGNVFPGSHNLYGTR